MGESWDLSTPAAPAYRDRSTGLVLFGLLEIVIAIFALGISLVAAFAMLSPAMQAMQGQANPRGNFAGLMVYPLAAAFFATMGVGSILGRRWARAIMLVVSWLWLAVGILGTAVMAFLLPKLAKTAFANAPAGQPDAAQAASGCFMVAMIVGVALIYIVLPGAFVLFYRSPHVKATCEEKDPHVRWTDRCPLPVLLAVFCAGYFALAGLIGMAYGVYPVAGRLLTGVASTLVYLAIAVINVLLVIGLYRLRPAAWWGSVAFCALTGISTLFLFLRGLPWREMYSEMGVPKDQVQVMEDSGMLSAFQGAGIVVPIIVGLVAAFAYLFWIRKYFYGYRDPESGPNETMVSAFS